MVVRWGEPQVEARFHNLLSVRLIHLAFMLLVNVIKTCPVLCCVLIDVKQTKDRSWCSMVELGKPISSPQVFSGPLSMLMCVVNSQEGSMITETNF